MRAKRPGAVHGSVAAPRRHAHEAGEARGPRRRGHVEALAVQAPTGGRLYTLSGAHEPYRHLVERMREGALTLAPDGTVVYCNARFAQMVGVPAEQVAGENLRSFIDAADHFRIDRLTASNEITDEMQLRRGPETAIPAQLAAATLEIDGLKTIAVVVTDLTHERTERGLREANRLKDEFLATLSHELRTPLNVILGWTRMLLGGHLSESARRHALELIDRNARAQAQLVDDLVDMSKTTTGQLRLEIEALPLVPMLETAVESVRSMAESKAIAIDTAWNERDLTVLADAARIQQVLWNLLSNAIKFTPGGGRIGVRVMRHDSRALIEVTDTGIGIDASFLPYVFDRFRQADSSNTRRYGGLGLGLAIVRDLVLLHGGEVTVRSAGPGEGATFTVTLRLSEASARVPERRQHFRLPGGLAGHAVLLIEEHEGSRVLLEQALHNAGSAVAGFPSGEAAFAALDRVQPSVIVADTTGAERDTPFINRLRTHPVPGIRSIPAIAIGDTADGQDAANGHAGYQRHLLKPIDPHLLVETIQDVMRKTEGEERISRKGRSKGSSRAAKRRR